MVGKMIFLPENIDIISTIIWGISVTVVGGIIVEFIRGNRKLDMDKTILYCVSTLFFGGLIWISWYNLPLYSNIILGDIKSFVTNDCTKGIDDWVQAYKIQSMSGLPYLKIGRCYNSVGNYDGAYQWLENGKAFQPQKEILTELGICFFGKKDYASSESNLEPVVISYPDYFEAQLYLGKSLHYQIKYRDSLPAFSKAYELNPNSSEVNYWLGWALFENFFYEKAVPYFQYSISNNYLLGRSHAGLGYCYLKLNNISEAKKEFNKALSLDNTQEDVQTALNELNNE